METKDQLVCLPAFFLGGKLPVGLETDFLDTIFTCWFLHETLFAKLQRFEDLKEAATSPDDRDGLGSQSQTATLAASPGGGGVARELNGSFLRV